MSKVTLAAAPEPARRVGVAAAKAHFSTVLKNAGRGPTIVHNRGRDVAVIVDDGLSGSGSILNLTRVGTYVITAQVAGSALHDSRAGGCGHLAFAWVAKLMRL